MRTLVLFGQGGGEGTYAEDEKLTSSLQDVLEAAVAVVPVKKLALPLISWGALWFGPCRWLFVTVPGNLIGQRTIKRRSR